MQQINSLNKNNFEEFFIIKLKLTTPPINMSQYEYEKYITTKEKLKETLSEFGVAIIPNVINEQEIENMKKGMWEYLEHITKKFPTPISRNQPESWKELYKLYPIHSMLLQHWGIGHAQFLWDLRQNEKILDIWSHLWNVKKENLLVSFDGASIHMPPETTGRGWFKEKKWLHSDQSFLRNDFECVQSWVTAYDVNEGDATLTFLESSHKYHNDFREKFHSIYPTTNEKENKKLKDDWYLLSVKEVKFYTQKGCVEKCIKCPAGSMVFWDSRTIHAGKEALQSREKPNFRCVGYICCTLKIIQSLRSLLILN